MGSGCDSTTRHTVLHNNSNKAQRQSFVSKNNQIQNQIQISGIQQWRICLLATINRCYCEYTWIWLLGFATVSSRYFPDGDSLLVSLQIGTLLTKRETPNFTSCGHRFLMFLFHNERSLCCLRVVCHLALFACAACHLLVLLRLCSASLAFVGWAGAGLFVVNVRSSTEEHGHCCGRT